MPHTSPQALQRRWTPAGPVQRSAPTRRRTRDIAASATRRDAARACRTAKHCINFSAVEYARIGVGFTAAGRLDGDFRLPPGSLARHNGGAVDGGLAEVTPERVRWGKRMHSLGTFGLTTPAEADVYFRGIRKGGVGGRFLRGLQAADSQAAGTRSATSVLRRRVSPPGGVSQTRRTSRCDQRSDARR